MALPAERRAVSDGNVRSHGTGCSHKRVRESYPWLFTFSEPLRLVPCGGALALSRGREAALFVCGLPSSRTLLLQVRSVKCPRKDCAWTVSSVHAIVSVRRMKRLCRYTVLLFEVLSTSWAVLPSGVLLLD